METRCRGVKALPGCDVVRGGSRLPAYGTAGSTRGPVAPRPVGGPAPHLPAPRRDRPPGVNGSPRLPHFRATARARTPGRSGRLQRSVASIHAPVAFHRCDGDLSFLRRMQLETNHRQFTMSRGHDEFAEEDVAETRNLDAASGKDRCAGNLIL